MQLVDAVQEIAMIDNNSNEWMSEEYKEILRDQEVIRYNTYAALFSLPTIVHTLFRVSCFGPAGRAVM